MANGHHQGINGVHVNGDTPQTNGFHHHAQPVNGVLRHEQQHVNGIHHHEQHVNGVSLNGRASTETDEYYEPIAIIGCAMRLPGESKQQSLSGT